MKIVVYVLIALIAFYSLAFSWKFILGLLLGCWFGYEITHAGDAPTNAPK